MPLLSDGIDIVVIAVAIFALGEALWVAAHLRRRPAEVIPVGRPWMGRQDWQRSWKPWLRGTAFGFPFGALPAGGAELPTFLSYVTEKKLSKHPEEFGKGAIEGVAGPEAANNASAAGTLVPMLSLGLPTNATAAVMLTAFVSYGIQPGPTLFEKEPLLIWTLIASLFIGNFLLLVLNLPLAPLWAKLLRTPRPYLYAGILFFATLGAFAVNVQPLDLALLLVFGLLGLMMRRFGLPVLPLIIGVILGPADRTSAAAEPAARRRRLEQPVHRARRDHRVHPDGGAAADAAGAEADAPQRGDTPDRRGRQGPAREGGTVVIVVGYSADPFGTRGAGTRHRRGEAARHATCWSINATAGDAYVDAAVRAVGARCTTSRSTSPNCGVEFELTQPVGVDTAEELLKAMERDDAELLVIGIRHRNPVGKLLLGSVSQQLLLECPKPVLAVKPKDG